MSDQAATNGTLAAAAVVGFIMSIGLFLQSKGILRTRYLVSVCYPISVMIGALTYFFVNPMFSTWAERIIAGLVGATLVTVGLWIILVVAKIDIDQWDKNRQ